jgi:hypothetical protein
MIVKTIFPNVIESPNFQALKQVVGHYINFIGVFSSNAINSCHIVFTVAASGA